MEVTANDIRDTVIQSLSLTYDWKSESHVADISFRLRDGGLVAFRITGLSKFHVIEDFGSRYVEFCTLIRGPGRIYLSLDPCEEGFESDRDGFLFVGREIARSDQDEDASNKSLERTRVE